MAAASADAAQRRADISERAVQRSLPTRTTTRPDASPDGGTPFSSPATEEFAQTSTGHRRRGSCRGHRHRGRRLDTAHRQARCPGLHRAVVHPRPRQHRNHQGTNSCRRPWPRRRRCSAVSRPTTGGHRRRRHVPAFVVAVQDHREPVGQGHRRFHRHQRHPGRQTRRHHRDRRDRRRDLPAPRGDRPDRDSAQRHQPGMELADPAQMDRQDRRPRQGRRQPH